MVFDYTRRNIVPGDDIWRGDRWPQLDDIPAVGVPVSLNIRKEKYDVDYC